MHSMTTVRNTPKEAFILIELTLTMVWNSPVVSSANKLVGAVHDCPNWLTSDEAESANITPVVVCAKRHRHARYFDGRSDLTGNQ